MIQACSEVNQSSAHNHGVTGISSHIYNVCDLYCPFFVFPFLMYVDNGTSLSELSSSSEGGVDIIASNVSSPRLSAPLKYA